MELNQEQNRVVLSNHPKILCTAGPGSGKTRVLVERVKRLIDSGVSGRQIACITFTNAAANEMMERLGNVRFGYIGTLHGFMMRIISRYGYLCSITGPLSVMDESTSEELMKEVAAEMSYRGSLAKLEEAADLCPIFKTVLLRSPDFLVACQYEKRMIQNKVIDYNHILSFGWFVLKKIEGPIFIDLDNPITHMMVDEFQDSGKWDWCIYRDINIPNRLFVGDPDQAIYSFRGGSVDHLMTLSREDDTESHTLQNNYRSDMAVCRSAQKLIEHNENRIAKATIPISGLEGTISIKSMETPIDELSWLTQELVKRDHSKTAVLVRTNKLATSISTWLKSASIPVAERKLAAKPIDWVFAKLIMAYHLQPNNDFIGYRLCKILDGDEIAGSIRKKAMEQFTTINDIRFKIQCVELREIPVRLARFKVSDDSIALVQSKIASLASFSDLSDLMMSLNTEDSVEVGHGVTVGTMHAAKGREWDVVYLPSFEHAIIPGTRRSTNLEEERRLAYVAITRARHDLIISWCKTRTPEYGSRSPQRQDPSQFIDEIFCADSQQKS